MNFLTGKSNRKISQTVRLLHSAGAFQAHYIIFGA